MSKDLHKRLIKGQTKQTPNFATRGLINYRQIKQTFRDEAKQRKQASGKDNSVIKSAPTEKQVDTPIVLEKTDLLKGGPDCPANANLKIPGRSPKEDEMTLDEALAKLQELEQWIQQWSRNQPNYERQKMIKIIVVWLTDT